MKRIVLVVLGTGMVAAACGGQGLESTSSALDPVWTAWVSEEQPQGVQCGLYSSQAATGAACRGSYCDDVKLLCGDLPQGFVKPIPVVRDYWSTPYVSEEQPGGVLCAQNYIVDGIRFTGSYSDNVSVHCVPATFPSQGVNCTSSPWFSEEQPPQIFDVNFYSYGGAVVTGVRCAGSYCDSMSFYLCEPKCRTSADCFGTCNNGVCVVG
jgi:hypothetical protein